MVLTVSFVVSPESRLVASVPLRSVSFSGVDTSVGVSGRHDFAVRNTRIRLVRCCVHRISCPTFCDDRETPLGRAGDARKPARDLPDVTSESARDTLARRANQVMR